MKSLAVCLAFTASALVSAQRVADSAEMTQADVHGSPRVATAHRNPVHDKELIMELERRWARAEEEFDPKVLDQVLASEFVSMDECGKIRNKAQEIASDRDWHPPGPEVFDDMSVRVYGDTAIVLARFTWTDRNTGTVKMQGRFVDTLLYRDGHWRVIANSYVRTDAAAPSACSNAAPLTP